MKSTALNIALLQARLTRNTANQVRLAAVTAIQQVAEENDPESITLLQAGLSVASLTVSQISASIHMGRQMWPVAADFVRGL